MCIMCGITQAPVCGAFGPCGPFLQQMFLLGMGVLTAGLAMLRIFARRLYDIVMNAIKTFAYSRYELPK